MTVSSRFKQERGFQSPRIHPLVALGVGVLLWYVQSLRPVLHQPIVHALQTLGLLAASAPAFEQAMAAAMLLRWVAAAVLLVFVVGVERLPLRSIGISTPKLSDMYWAAVAGWLGILAGIGLYLLVQGFRPGSVTAADQIVDRLSLLGQINLLLNAAIVEELFFRGLLIERITALTQRAWIGGVVSYVLFVVSHMAGSGITESFTIVAVSALVLTLLYLWRRNLVLCMLAHVVGNAPTLFS